jgi:hypothetical protein
MKRSYCIEKYSANLIGRSEKMVYSIVENLEKRERERERKKEKYFSLFIVPYYLAPLHF